MTAEGLGTESIFKLGERFVRLTKRYHRIVDATWENPGLYFAKSRREKRLLRKITSITLELLKRYQGLMYEVYRESGNAPLTNDRFQHVQDTTWLIVQDRVVVMADHKSFFGALWSAYSGRMKKREGISQYKPKFMLLPFVDAMPAGNERRVLMAAYGCQEELKWTDDAALAEMITGAFSVLHEQLTLRAADLGMLTNGLTNDDEVSSIMPPFEKLQEWIFRVTEEGRWNDESKAEAKHRN